MKAQSWQWDTVQPRACIREAERGHSGDLAFACSLGEGGEVTLVSLVNLEADLLLCEALQALSG